MVVGVFIPYHPILDKYLEKVEKQFSQWDKIVTRKAFYDKEEEPDVRNEVKNMDCDLVFTIDADELLLKEDQRKIVKLMSESESDACFCPVLNYISSFNCIYEQPKIVHKPVVMVKPDTINFYRTRCLEHKNGLHLEDIYLHHLGFTYSKEVMKWKYNNYWDTKDTIDRVIARDIIEHPIPDELKELLL